MFAFRQRSKSASDYDDEIKKCKNSMRECDHEDCACEEAEDGRLKIPRARQTRRSEPGIVCTDSDLESILSGRDVELRGGQRKSITMITKGFMIRGFLSPELARTTTHIDRDKVISVAEERRRISTGSFDLSPKDGKDTGRRLSNIDRERIVSWDEEKDFSIDPLVIGSVIETYLKKPAAAPSVPVGPSSPQFLAVPGTRVNRGASISVEEQRKGPGSELAKTLLARRTKSVDASAANSARLSSGGSLQPPSYLPLPSSSEKRYLTVDECDSRPRKLSLKSAVASERRHSTRLQTQAQIEKSFKEMTIV